MRALNIAATGMAAQNMRVEVISHNLANMSTTAYNARRAEFSDLHYQQIQRPGTINSADGAVLPAGVQLGLGVRAAAVSMQVAQGSVAETGGALDLAIEGEGYFTVQTPEGERLTRAGAFMRDADGQIVNADGHLLLDEGGGPILVPLDAQTVSLAADGTLSADGLPVAQLGLVRVEDPTKLFREAGVLFRADADPVPVEDPRVVQGFLEQSNVSAVAEMARMIEVQRAYEYGQKLMDQEDERIRLVVRVLGQTS